MKPDGGMWAIWWLAVAVVWAVGIIGMYLTFR